MCSFLWRFMSWLEYFHLLSKTLRFKMGRLFKRFQIFILVFTLFLEKNSTELLEWLRSYNAFRFILIILIPIIFLLCGLFSWLWIIFVGLNVFKLFWLVDGLHSLKFKLVTFSLEFFYMMISLPGDKCLHLKCRRIVSTCYLLIMWRRIRRLVFWSCRHLKGLVSLAYFVKMAGTVKLLRSFNKFCSLMLSFCQTFSFFLVCLLLKLSLILQKGE